MDRPVTFARDSHTWSDAGWSDAGCGSLTRREWVRFGVGAGLSTSRLFAAPAAPANVILIVATGVGSGDLGCYGNTFNRTPNLNRLAQQGARFSCAYTAAPDEPSARFGLISGQPRTADLERNAVLLREGSLARRMKKSGRRTAVLGTWNIPDLLPNRADFDDFRGNRGGQIDYFTHRNPNGDDDWWHNDKPDMEMGYAPDVISRYAIEFIDKNRSKPFGLYLPYQSVHPPLQGPGDAAIRDVGPIAVDGPPVDPRIRYRTMLEVVDDGVGRVVRLLERLSLLEKTLLVFTSSRGAVPPGSNGGLRGHGGELWEGGLRVPLLLRQPGGHRAVPAGSVIEDPVTLYDVVPTLVDFVRGEEKPSAEPGAGISLWPRLVTGRAVPSRTLVWRAGQASTQSAAVRVGDWKLIVRSGEEPFLANLSQDPGEQTNLASREPERVKQMLALLPS